MCPETGVHGDSDPVDSVNITVIMAHSLPDPLGHSVSHPVLLLCLFGALPSPLRDPAGDRTMVVGTSGSCLFGAYARVSVSISLHSLYTCVLEAPLGQTARKWLQLAVFCSPLAPGQTHLQLRVYFLNNTPCALQWAITNEQPHGGRMRGPCQLFDFTGARADQCLKLKYISEGEVGPGGWG